MRKLISLILALMMALMAVPALAETVAPDGKTMDLRMEVNGDALLQLMAPGADASEAAEAMGGFVDTIVSILNNISIRVSTNQTGMQGDLLLKDQSVAMAALQMGEKGAVIVTDVLPSYVLSLSGEKIQELLGQLTGGAADAIALDPENLEKLTEKIAPILEKFQSWIGEPEAAEYTFEGMVFPVKMPVNVTVKEILTTVAELARTLLAEKTVAATMEKIGLTAEQAEEKIKELEETPEENLPVLTAASYANEAGDSLFDILLTKDEQMNITVQAGTVGGKTVARVNAMDSITVKMDLDSATGILNANVTLNMPDMVVGLDANGMSADGMLNGTLVVSLNDNRLLAMDFNMVAGGEITADFGTEGKTELKLDSLTKGSDSKVMETLQAAIMPGIMGILAKAMNIMPEEIGAVMQMLMPQQETTTAE